MCLILNFKIFRHNATEHNFKKNISTQTIQTISRGIIKADSAEKNKSYEKLKKYLYPDLFGSPNDKNGKKNNCILMQSIYLLLNNKYFLCYSYKKFEYNSRMLFNFNKINGFRKFR